MAMSLEMALTIESSSWMIGLMVVSSRPLLLTCFLLAFALYPFLSFALCLASLSLTCMVSTDPAAVVSKNMKSSNQVIASALQSGSVGDHFPT